MHNKSKEISSKDAFLSFVQILNERACLASKIGPTFCELIELVIGKEKNLLMLTLHLIFAVLTHQFKL